MKRSAILGTATMIFIMAITSMMQVFGQSTGLAKQQAQKVEANKYWLAQPIPTASATLEKIVGEIVKGSTPIEIYPPGYLDWLEKMGDETMYEMSVFQPGASALTAGDQGNMAYIPPGTFTMGSPTNEALRYPVEVQHAVTITSGFYIGKYEVTQGEYLAIVGSNPSYHTPANNYDEDLNRPVEYVSWHNATNYCGLLTQQELTAGRIQSGWTYRLPTEAEWEYACRAGTTTAFNFGNVIQGGDANFETHHTYDASSGTTFVSSPAVPYLNRTDTVGNYVNNAWGLFDMHGNVWEWCQDWYAAYPTGSAVDPKGPASGANRVIRGSYFQSAGSGCRSAMHEQYAPSATSLGVGFRIVLAPTTPGWYQSIATASSQPTYGNCPTKVSGKDSLVLVTHGWSLKVPGFPIPVDVPWINDMSNSISGYLTSHSLTNWQVYGYKWITNSWTVWPSKALNNARQQGEVLGDCLAAQGWAHVHLIGNSAGAALIQAVSERIKVLSPSTTVHCTFLDPFVGFDYVGVPKYGIGADWADQYFTRDFLTSATGPYTESPLDHAYNVDVTQLDPNKVPAQGLFFSTPSGQIEQCYGTIPTHEGARQVYQNTITGNTNSYYAGFGFPFSKEGGNWSFATNQYHPGNTTSQKLGVSDPTCTISGNIQLEPRLHINTLLDFTQWPTIESDTGTIQKYTNYFNLLSGSPAWLATVVTLTNPVNVVTFNANFTSGAGAQGLLTILWDDQVIGSIDGRIVNTNHYTFRFQNAIANSVHILGFRLDPLTNIQSIVTVTNVVLNQVGPSQPFSLATTTNTVSGLLVYQLTGEAGFEYGIQASTNLVNWTTIATLVNTNRVVSFYDQDSTNHPMRFYRAVAPY